MILCRASTKKGTPCSIEARPSGLCHIHDPDALFQQQQRDRSLLPAAKRPSVPKIDGQLSFDDLLADVDARIASQR